MYTNVTVVMISSGLHQKPKELQFRGKRLHQPQNLLIIIIIITIILMKNNCCIYVSTSLSQIPLTQYHALSRLLG